MPRVPAESTCRPWAEARKNVETRHRELGRAEFEVYGDLEQFPGVCTVFRRGRGGTVEFSLSDDSIKVRRVTNDHVEAEMSLQAGLDEQGQCVLVRGDRHILRWHVLCELLGPLFGFGPWRRP